MKLNEYPRPINDNGRGLHWSPVATIWGEDNWDFWKQELIDMNIKWVKVIDHPGGVAQGLIERLLDIGIFPIVRFYINEQNPGAMTVRAPATVKTIERYVKLGVRYFETNNEPDSDREWESGRPRDWLEIVTMNYLTDWTIITNAGGIAGFPSFSFGGGRQNPFELIKQWGAEHVFDRIWIPIHNYGLNRPWNYPNDSVNINGKQLTRSEYEEYGGMWAFERPLENVNNSRWSHRVNKSNRDEEEFSELILEDFTCFRAYERFNAWFESVTGFSVPIITTEGGWNVSAFVDDRYPKLSPKHASVETMLSETLTDWPEYYFSNMYWLVACNRIGAIASDYESQSLYGHWWDSKFGTKGQLPLVDAWKKSPGYIRGSGPIPDELPLYKYPWPDDRNWDDAIKFTNPRHYVELAEHNGGEYWKLQTIQWDKDGSGRVYIRCLVDNEYQDVVVQVNHENGYDVAHTKGPLDDFYGNLPVYGESSIEVPDFIPCDKLHGIKEGTIHATYVLTEGENNMAFDYKKWIQIFQDHEAVYNDADPYGVKVVQVPSEWKIIGVHHLTPDENAGGHNLFIDVLDHNGNRIKFNHTNVLEGSIINWGWAGMRDDEKTTPAYLDKGDSEPGTNIPIWWGQHIWAEVRLFEGLKADRIENVHTAHDDEPLGNTRGHHSYYVVWQHTPGKPSEPDPEPPPNPIPEPPDEEIDYLKVIRDIYQIIKPFVE